ncbi:MAG: patatin family protein [Lachnospiraceae bacterium]|nr:patatin family protein [Lachnospiraceae bacterium]
MGETKMKNGLVLEGGAMRGMYTAGVLDVFMENNIEFDNIVGVSAGALFGINFLTKQKGRAIRYSKRFNRDRRYMGLGSLIKTGNIVNTEFAYKIVPTKYEPVDDETFMKQTTPFYAVITEVESGEAEYVKINSVYEQMDTLRASGSMPFVSKLVEINGKNYLDGAIADGIPYKWMQKQGCEKIVVILTRDINYKKRRMPEALIRLYYSKLPKTAEALRHRHEIYNAATAELRELEKSGEVFVIRPSEEIHISKIEKNPDKLQAVYDLGRKDGAAMLQKLKEYMA